MYMYSKIVTLNDITSKNAARGNPLMFDCRLILYHHIILRLCKDAFCNTVLEVLAVTKLIVE